MFGIVYGIFNLTGTIISGARAAKTNNECIRKGKEKRTQGDNRAGIYYDRKGATRLLDTHEIVSIDNLYCAEAKGKDCYMYDIHGRPMRNLSEELRQERLRKALSNPDPRRTVIEWEKGISPALVGYNGNPLYAGDTYKDLQTGAIYVCRYFNYPKEICPFGGSSYYMDVKTGLLVRESDSALYNRKNKQSTEAQKFIEYFNDKQKKEGFLYQSRIKKVSGWNATESEYDKRERLNNYYCNRFDYPDLPCRN